MEEHRIAEWISISLIRVPSCSTYSADPSQPWQVSVRLYSCTTCWICCDWRRVRHRVGIRVNIGPKSLIDLSWFIHVMPYLSMSIIYDHLCIHIHGTETTHKNTAPRSRWDQGAANCCSAEWLEPQTQWLSGPGSSYGWFRLAQHGLIPIITHNYPLWYDDILWISWLVWQD